MGKDYLVQEIEDHPDLIRPKTRSQYEKKYTYKHVTTLRADQIRRLKQIAYEEDTSINKLIEIAVDQVIMKEKNIDNIKERVTFPKRFEDKLEF